MRDKDLLWQLPLTGADVMLGDRKQEEKLVLCLHISPSQRGVKEPELYKLLPSIIASPQSC